MPGSVSGRIERRNQARIASLAISIKDRGIDAAIEFAKSAVDGTSDVGHAFRRNAVLALFEHQPDGQAVWRDHTINVILRQHCASVMERGEELSPALRAFAAKALVQPAPPKGRGRRNDQWVQVLAIAALRDLSAAGVPVYHNGSTDAAFYAVDAVAAAMGIKERRLRDWWQDRDDLFGPFDRPFLVPMRCKPRV